MFLSPHHFQQWERYQDGILNFRLRSTMPFYWGLMDLEVNQEILENGSFGLLSCRGVLPSGISIDIPGTDDAPANRAIEEHFAPSLQTLDVYLAIPSDRPGSANCRLEGDDSSADDRAGVYPVH